MIDSQAIAALVARARDGDYDAGEALARAFLRPAYLVALSVIGRAPDAEDIAQEAFVRAFERLDSCREPAHFAGWLFQIVRNQAKNARKHSMVRERSLAAGVDPDSVGGEQRHSQVTQARLLQALASIGAVQREVVLLHDLEDWTHGEISAALGVSEVMSRQHLFCARKKLRAAISEPGLRPLLRDGQQPGKPDGKYQEIGQPAPLVSADVTPGNTPFRGGAV